MIHSVAKRRRGRPPKSLDGYSQTRTDLLRIGVIALTEKGFSATGLDEILRRVDVPKGSFYHYFESKEAFGLELINSYNDYFVDKLNSIYSNPNHTPLQRLRDFVTVAQASMERYEYTRGCLVGNLGQEMGALPESYRARLIEVFVDWQKRTAACLKEAQLSGEIAAKINCDEIAEYFWIGWEGAVLRAKLERGQQPLHVFADGFFAGLKT